MTYKYIETDQQLAEIAVNWLTLDKLALDSEFMRVDTFYPKLALIQVNDGQQVYLIDPLDISDWQPLVDVFRCKTVLKILHSCNEDLEAFNHNVGELPRPIFDTQLAASMASVGSAMGYQRLAKATLDVDVEKGETRSNWLKRPLTDSQLHYAAEDVNHLLHIAEILESKLTELNRLDWFKEDCTSLLNDWIKTQSKGYSYHRVKQAWMLKPHQLNVLNQLVIWREKRCKEVDMPRAHLISDALLVDVAKRLPQSVNMLASIKGIKAPTLRKEGQVIVDVIQACKDIPKDLWPNKMDRPLSPVAGEMFKTLRKEVNSIAEQLDIPPEILIRKKQLEGMLRQGYPNGPFAIPEALNGWRQSVVAHPILELLNQLAKQ